MTCPDDPTPSPPSPEALLALAHALRTPLTSLALGIGLLDDGTLGALSAAQREVVRVLASDVARLQTVLDAGLNTDRLGTYAGPVERTATDLAGLVREAARPLAAQARAKGVRLALDLPSAVVVAADPVKLTWVVASLLGNALRYSPRGRAIVATLRVDGAHAALQIVDQGQGVPPAVAARIFDRDGGRGLALCLVREVVEAHGGQIGIESQVGRGSTFTVTLPLAVGPRARGRGGP